MLRFRFITPKQKERRNDTFDSVTIDVENAPHRYLDEKTFVKNYLVKKSVGAGANDAQLLRREATRS